MEKRDFGFLFEPTAIQVGTSTVVIKPMSGADLLEYQRSALLHGTMSYRVLESLLVDFTDAPLLNGGGTVSRAEIDDDVYSRVLKHIDPVWVSEVLREAVDRAQLTEDERKNSSSPHTSSNEPDPENPGSPSAAGASASTGTPDGGVSSTSA